MPREEFKRSWRQQAWRRGGQELASRLRSAVSPIYDARQPLDRIRDHIASRADLGIAA